MQQAVGSFLFTTDKHIFVLILILFLATLNLKVNTFLRTLFYQQEKKTLNMFSAIDVSCKV